MIINLSQQENVHGAIVLGTHSLRFAKGSGVANLASRPRAGEEPRELEEFAGFKIVYSSNTQLNKSFLEIEGEEIDIDSLPAGSEFLVDFASFGSSNMGSAPMAVDPGLMAIIAPTRWGKSTLLWAGLVPSFIGVEPTAVNFVEVYEDTHGYPIIYTALEKRLLKNILLMLLEPKSVLAVDSLRAFIYAKSVGGTGTAGLDQYFSIQLTALGNICASTGTLLVATINPMIGYEEEKDKKRYEEIVTQLVAAATFAIVGTERRVVDLYPRGFSHPSRDPVSMRVADLKDRSLAKAIPKASQTPSVISIETTGQADNSTVIAARRLILASKPVKDSE